MLSAASRAQLASISAIAPKSVSSWADVAVATLAPRRGLTSISPVEASNRIASRTGVRDTPKRSASAISSRRKPGGNSPDRTFSAIEPARRSACVDASIALSLKTLPRPVSSPFLQQP